MNEQTIGAAPAVSRNFLNELGTVLTSFDPTLFHFERPLWLLGLLAAALLTAALWYQKKQRSNWHKHIDNDLLEHLLDGELVRTQKRLYIGLFCAWFLACFALAGPSWHKLPQPVHKTESAQVILFDLSPSMTAEDLKPSRLIRARLKLIDLLQAQQEGLYALVAYAGEAHVVTPLTDDTDTIISQLPALSPNIMPMAGSNVEMAVDKALQLFTESGLTRGDILLITDGVTTDAAETVRKKLNDTAFRLSILGAGTNEGAPIATGRGGFARDSMGGIVIAKLESAELKELASDLGGRFSILQSGDRDIKTLNSLPSITDQQTRTIEREFDTWQDAGQWLVLLLLPFALFAFRRGMILPALLLIPFMPQPASAMSWQDLWQTPDQQGQALLQQGDAKTAAETFKNPQWQGSALYKAGDFDNAAKKFAAQDSAQSHYNQGNALARGGKLEEALAAYDKALSLQTDFDDAQFNRDLVEKLMQEQEQQDPENSDEKNSDENSDEQSEQDSAQNSEQNSEQNQDGEPSDKKDESEQSESNDQQSDDNSNEEPSDSQQQSPEGDEKDSEQESKQPDYSEDEKDTNDPEESEEQQPEPAQNEPEQSPEETQAQQAQTQPLSPEEQAEQEQLERWLRGIPDDPGGLLREKFKYQHQQQLRDSMRGRDNKPENGAADRW